MTSERGPGTGQTTCVDLEFINLDMWSAVQIVRGTIPEILEPYEKFRVLGHFDIDNVDSLQEFALATGHLHN